MPRALDSIFCDRTGRFSRRTAALLAAVVLFNLLTLAWALAAFGGSGVLLGTALLAYGLGLRHAVDADHIAAIDNVTRKLMQDGKRPAAVGLFFSLGHSAVVALASLAIAVATIAFRRHFVELRTIGGIVGTLVSAVFLLAIGVANLIPLRSLLRLHKRVRNGETYLEGDLDSLLAGRGLLAGVFRPLFGLIRHSWQMCVVGFLFGLGFDTATEIGVLGISASQSSSGMVLGTIMAFPALFAAGMSLIDTTDGLVVMGVYGWAFVDPLRRLGYNIAVTSASAAVALLVGGVEAAGLLTAKFGLNGWISTEIEALNARSTTIGLVIVAALATMWLASIGISYQRRRNAIRR
ncbi:MAG: HoxN/HupN/NixA family nickel/cobalt transporter [Alphaproteobacteria bacterium]|nr:HoxN/HupN/NixA family nickel/cobalt transporter [Alphaproteobacteria bacterium]